MSSPYDRAIEEMMADYERRLDELNESQREIRKLTATATATRRTVTATVGSRGELVELKFPTDAYKRLPPVELANIIIDTVAEARKKVSAQVAELATANAPAGFDLSTLFGPDPDLRKVLPREPRLTDAAREYVDRGRKFGPAG